MGKAVSHLAVQVISYINGEKKPDFWHCKLVIYYLMPRQGKIRRWNNKISDWVWLADAGHAEDVDWLFEVSEINHLWKGMSFVYSVVSVASTQFLENCFLQCSVFSPGYCFLYVQSVQHLLSLLPIIPHHTGMHDLHCPDWCSDGCHSVLVEN